MKKKYLIIPILLILLVGGMWYGNIFSLVGRTGTFVLTSYDCRGDVDACREGSVNLVANPKYGSSSGDATVKGYLESLPFCGQYELSLSVDAGGTQCASNTYVDVDVNNVEVGSWRTYGERRTSGYQNQDGDKVIDVSRLVGGRNRSDITFTLQVVHDGEWGRSCGVTAANIKMNSYECEGDRYFVSTCPLWEGYNIKGAEFKSGDVVTLNVFPEDAYFCKSQPAIIKDENNRVIGNSDTIYERVHDGASFVVPDGQSYIFIFATITDESQISDLNIVIGDLQKDLAAKIQLIKDLNLRFDQISIVISAKEATIANLLTIAEALRLSEQELMFLIDDYQIKIEELEANAALLKEKNKALLIDLIKAQGNAEYRARLLEAASLTNAELGVMLSDLKLKNSEYAAIFDEIALTIYDDAEILDNMGKNNEDIIDIIVNMKRDVSYLNSLVDKITGELENSELLRAEFEAKLIKSQRETNVLLGFLGDERDRFLSQTFTLKLIIGGLSVFVLLLILAFIFYKRK